MRESGSESGRSPDSRSFQVRPQKARTGAKEKDPDTVDLEKRVSDALGLKVTVSHRDPGGSVQINYRNLDQLDEVMRRLAKGAI